jgi:hypothetical protein
MIASSAPCQAYRMATHESLGRAIHHDFTDEVVCHEATGGKYNTDFKLDKSFNTACLINPFLSRYQTSHLQWYWSAVCHVVHMDFPSSDLGSNFVEFPQRVLTDIGININLARHRQTDRQTDNCRLVITIEQSLIIKKLFYSTCTSTNTYFAYNYVVLQQSSTLYGRTVVLAYQFVIRNFILFRGRLLPTHRGRVRLMNTSHNCVRFLVQTQANTSYIDFKILKQCVVASRTY